jgi:hypothetical protein
MCVNHKSVTSVGRLKWHGESQPSAPAMDYRLEPSLLLLSSPSSVPFVLDSGDEKRISWIHTRVQMWLEAPIAYPLAKLLDRLLGEEHGTTYRKAG